jgi:CRISPR/Cas system type I-B associated protein Csh2 (Cas7 group RAMP superfamily)
LREDQPETGLSGATGLTQEEFTQLQKSIVTLRNNLIKSMNTEE